MQSVKIIRRWGSHKEGDTVKVDNIQARWLVDHAIGTTNGVQAPAQEGFMPGANGSDPIVSGDGTRRPVIAVVKGERRDNNALPVDGSPDQDNANRGRDTQASGSEGKADGKAPVRRRKVS